MNNICDFNGIYWKEPFERFAWQGLCSGNAWFVLGFVVLVAFYIYLKSRE